MKYGNKIRKKTFKRIINKTKTENTNLFKTVTIDWSLIISSYDFVVFGVFAGSVKRSS